MRLLWVKVGGLWPLTAGGRLRSFHIVSELSRRHEVVVLTTHGPGDDPGELRHRLPDCREVVSVPFAAPKVGTRAFARALARSWLSPLPVDLWRWRVPDLRRRIERRLAARAFDACVADFLPAVPNLPEGISVPVVLFEHNVEHVIWKRLAEVERRPWRRIPLEVEWRKMRRFEAGACSRAQLTLAVSDTDAAALSRIAPAARIRAIPTGVDTAYFHPNGFAESPANIVFTGSMDWYPNEDGVLYFIEAILPRVRRVAPHASFTVVGRNPSPRLLALAEAAGVQVTGRVEDVRPHVAQAAVYVVPLRIGGGTRLKIFEALAMAKAVVSTTVGAEGLPLTDRHFVRADQPDAFAGAVVSLLGDPARRRAFGEAGRRLMEERYSWAFVAHEFESQLENVLTPNSGDP